jgi:hypothetical protein
MSGTAKIILIGGAVLLGVYVVVQVASPSRSTPRTTSTPNVLGGLGSSLGGFISSAFGSAGAANQPATSVATPQSTAAANYIADATAASDDQTGVVGFGGWD